MSNALQTLVGLVDHPDPYRHAPDQLYRLQVEAINERFAQKRKQIKLLDHRAREGGIEQVRHLQDAIPLLFADANFKSYPEAFVEQGRWDRMTRWLQTLSAHAITGMDHARVHDMDSWIAELRRNGHYVMSSSGTSGKQSFINQSEADRRIAAYFTLQNLTWASSNFRERGSYKYPTFVTLPSGGAYTATERVQHFVEMVGKPGDIHWMSHVPQSADQLLKMVRMRRAMADGTAKPGEIAAFEAENAQRQKKIGADMAQWMEHLLSRRDEPIFITGMMAMLYAIVAAGKQRGIADGAFHPQTVVSVGGGRKGANLPPDFEDQCRRFFKLGPTNYMDGYGMGEISGFCPISHATGGWVVPPWLVPLVLDKKGEVLLNPADGKGEVEGRMAFIDLMADGRWGGVISGDKVVVDFSPKADGLKVPNIRTLARYRDLDEGDEKLSCAGTIDAYVRGVVEA